ncbi:hypothetical protein BH18ACT6_BH18ACT6_06990 [soil metagenome]
MKTLLFTLSISLVASLPGVVTPPIVSSTSLSVEVRQSGGLTADTIARVRSAAAMSGSAVTELHRVTLRLMAVRRAEVIVQAPPDGFGYPLLASAMDSFPPLLAPEIRSVLGGGQVVMGALTAALRGAQVGDFVTLESPSGGLVELAIGAIVPDELIYWSEVLVDRPTGAQLGIDRPFALFLWGGDPVRTEEALGASQLDMSVRVVGPNTAPLTDPVLPVAFVKQRFGEFSMRAVGVDEVEVDPIWKEANIVAVDLAPLGTFECHRLLVPYLRGVVDDLAREQLLDQLDPADFQLAGGCFNARLNRGSDPGFSVSRHTWGIAIDINPTGNAFGAPPSLSPAVVEVFRRWGFSWGGTWHVPDGMHFEWRQLPMEYTTTCANLSLAPLFAGGLWYLRPASADC